MTTLRRSARRGASAIEFALTLPVVLLVFSAVIEYGWVFSQQQAVLNAVRDGLRFGVTIQQDDDPEAQTETRTAQVLEGFNLPCDETVDCVITATLLTADNGWDYIELDLSYTYEPIMGGILPTPPQIRAVMTMAIEDQ